MDSIIVSIISGGAVVAVIEGIREGLSWRRNRRAIKEDRAEEKSENLCKAESEKIARMSSQIEALTESQKFIMYDRIRFLGQAYISEKQIDFDDRRILNNMHKSYHFGLHGNGDLDVLMAEVNKLPLKQNNCK